ncbi:hypothetical protein HU200_064161 [Digitaria exilis]|uniref:F-box/LRR-repeat protein n=1 Tax=Digitaria exilis TaxID=1010633 RepID=A0A835DWQ1_9POAL|nr:hypothetical protein HU200_064161 [Digitaria exilis]
MHLALDGVALHLPATAVFASLADLCFESIKFPSGSSHLLLRLVSSACCPHLQRLQLRKISVTALSELLLEASALLELYCEDIHDMRFLELRTPSLKILHVTGCYSLVGLTVSAPRLEELEFLVQHHLHIDTNGDDKNDSSIHLLECCRLIRCLQVQKFEQRKKQYVDIIKSWIIPQLPHVTSLTVRVTLWSPHSYAAGVASLLAQCKSIRYLSLQLCCCFIKTKKLVLSCDKSSQWKSHELSLAHVQEAEFKKLIGTADELQFIQFILTRASGIQKVAVSFNRDYWSKCSEEDGFKALPSVAGGSWTTCNIAYLSYEWTRYV